ncbi:MAG: BON domain-containing protein [Pseudobdellovibrionaceae bacterium]
MKQLVVIAGLILTGSFAGAVDNYDSEITGRPRESTYSTMKAADKSLEKRALKSLQEDPDLSNEAKHINIRVRNGQATLSGAVLNQDEISMINKKVMAIQGIHSVNSKLKVQE